MTQLPLLQLELEFLLNVQDEVAKKSREKSRPRSLFIEASFMLYTCILLPLVIRSVNPMINRSTTQINIMYILEINKEMYEIVLNVCP